jgi:hypothetical protein
VSSYGTAVVVDVPGDAELAVVTRTLTSQIGDTYELAAPDGWRRATAYLHEPGRLDDIAETLKHVRTARAAFAEDFDEYGALWAVISVDAGEVRTIHRRWVLNADPDDAAQVQRAIEDAGEDPRQGDVRGEQAATEAATLFGADPAAMIDAERASESAYKQIGTIGGPFPW